MTRSVIDENASAVAESIAEVALDAALDTEPLKEIPVVSLSIKTFALGRRIRDRIFLKKLMALLAEASRVTPEERKGEKGSVCDSRSLGVTWCVFAE